jgi:hypothetical protein
MPRTCGLSPGLEAICIYVLFVCIFDGVSINIKNSAAEAALRELIALTGESQGEAVEVAARERIARLRAADREQLVRADIMVLQGLARDSPLNTDDLYDAAGLPR